MDEFIASKLVFIRDKLKRCLLWKLAHVAVQPSFSQETQYLIDGYSAVYSICEHLVAEFGKSLYLLQFAERKVRDEIRQLRFSLISFPVFHQFGITQNRRFQPLTVIGAQSLDE